MVYSNKYKRGGSSRSRKSSSRSNNFVMVPKNVVNTSVPMTPGNKSLSERFTKVRRSVRKLFSKKEKKETNPLLEAIKISIKKGKLKYTTTFKSIVKQSFKDCIEKCKKYDIGKEVMNVLNNSLMANKEKLDELQNIKKRIEKNYSIGYINLNGKSKIVSLSKIVSTKPKAPISSIFLRASIEDKVFYNSIKKAEKYIIGIFSSFNRLCLNNISHIIDINIKKLKQKIKLNDIIKDTVAELKKHKIELDRFIKNEYQLLEMKLRVNKLLNQNGGRYKINKNKSTKKYILH